MKLKFLIATLLTSLLAFAIGLFNLPWYSFVITSLLVAATIPQKKVKAFLSGLLGIGLLWLTLILIIDFQNNHILSVRIANMFKLGGSTSLLVIINTILGSLLGGLGALTGHLIRKSFSK